MFLMPRELAMAGLALAGSPALDLALLRVPGAPLTPAHWRPSSALRAGSLLLAVSRPRGGLRVRLGLLGGVGPGFPPFPCNGLFKPGTPVQLTALAAPDSIFVGWGGACVGALPTCTIMMSQHFVVSASFAPAQSQIVA